ncbi:TlpA family protein disulfide reductase [Streptomyces smyrnaeus]|uniref:TlpA family protein disulfide reductase n=1 Tax=Streptomyces smyrnaeus TaxID=1387713 RepID=A0ABS3Y1M7_9ACTN|nr:MULTISPECIES: TlpA disulfide reductase family protein [Streptomyces]MBO8201569.1 TlpA family protein disulfide reductase [Streptomyces smyrnaeus]MBQ0866670.1 TlpA family protein disulfide reductase [Streptomyces sp. RK75]MBQ1122502.1 TlpA family protein disulfide reductase [Streptomyces sp. B15]MBQ1158566.1 TlpA family protein disulfide reductase [Streptomyces sp. A73]
MSQTRASRRRTTLLAAGVAAGALLLSGCGDEQTGSSSGDTKFVQGTGQITKVAKDERTSVPNLTGPSVDGKKLKLSDYKGKVIVLNVWGSWCSPCRAEAPNLAKVARDTKDEGVQFLGINTRDLDKANAKAFERNYDIDYPSFYDPSGKLILKFPKNTLSPQAIPSTLILDKDGKVAVRALKELSEKELRSALAPLIDAK